MQLLREFCAENMTLVPAAIKAGARRIELCDNLAVGGTTPSRGVIRAAVAHGRKHGVNVMVMIRPRGGDFCYSEAERDIMLDDIATARSLGATGVVFGCLCRNGSGAHTLDVEMLEQLMHAAKGQDDATPPLDVTFHMAFDELAPEAQPAAIDTLANLDIDRILTHGGPAGTAILDNITHLQALIAHAASRLIILPGGGITWQNAAQVAGLLGVAELHGTRIVPVLADVS